MSVCQHFINYYNFNITCNLPFHSLILSESMFVVWEKMNMKYHVRFISKFLEGAQILLYIRRIVKPLKWDE